MAARLILESEIIPVSNPPVLLYGVPGAGKTSMAYTANKALLLDFDGGAHRSGFRKATLRFDTWADVIEARQGGMFNDFETIILDTVGTCLEYLSVSIIDGNSKMGNRTGGLSMQGWGVLKSAFGTFLSDLRVQGKQVIMIAHQKEEKDGDARMLRPDIAGGSYGIVMQCADIVGYVSYRNGKRHVAWDPTDSYFAKNGAGLKSAAIPDFGSKPTFMADLLAEAKKNLGHTSEASAVAVKTVADWQEKLAVCETPEAMNKLLVAIGKAKLKEPVKGQVWHLFLAHAKENEWEWDAAKKEFKKLAVEAA